MSPPWSILNLSSIFPTVLVGCVQKDNPILSKLPSVFTAVIAALGLSALILLKASEAPYCPLPPVAPDEARTSDLLLAVEFGKKFVSLSKIEVPSTVKPSAVTVPVTSKAVEGFGLPIQTLPLEFMLNLYPEAL